MASTNFIDNQTVIYAAWLNDVNNAVYNGIFASPSITATNFICNGTASGAGFTSLINNTFASPAAIGNVTPNTGAFTALTANTVTASTPIAAASGGLGAVVNPGGANNIIASNGTNWISKPLLDYFVSSLGNSGYQKLPSGLIIQWGQYNSTISDTSGVNIVFPIGFPAACFVINSLLISNSPITGSSVMSMHGYIAGNGSATFYVSDIGSVNNAGFYWIALGY